MRAKPVKSTQFYVRVSEEERAWLEQEADRQGLESTSSYVRKVLRLERAASASDRQMGWPPEAA